MKMKSKLKKETDTLEQFLSRVEDYSNRIDNLASNVESLKSVNNRILNEPSQTERKKHLSSQAEIVGTNKVQGRKLQKEMKEEKQKLAKLSGDLSGAENTIRNTQLQTITKRFLDVWTEYNTVQLEFREKNKKALLRNLRVVDPSSTISTEELEKRLDEGDVTVLSSILKESDQAKEDLKLLERRHSEFVKLEKGITEINEMFIDLSHLVESQGEVVDRIDLQVGQARDHVESGREQLRQAEASQKSARRKKFILAALLAGVAIIVIVILLFSFL